MTDINANRTRRAFFLRGGALLGAGVATAAGAEALLAQPTPALPDEVRQLQNQLGSRDDCDAIRQLHLDFIAAMEHQAYEAATELFHEGAQLDLSGLSAVGKPAIARLFAEQYRQQRGAALHTASRQTASQRKDRVRLSDDRGQACATFHAEVQISTPLPEDFTVAQMARLQGQMADHRWEAGRFDAQYVKVQGLWKMASLRYVRT